MSGMEKKSIYYKIRVIYSIYSDGNADWFFNKTQTLQQTR